MGGKPTRDLEIHASGGAEQLVEAFKLDRKRSDPFTHAAWRGRVK